MKLTLFCFGKLKESFYRDAVAEYAKRLKPYVQLEIVEFPDEPIADNPSEAEMEAVKQKEGDRLLAKLPEGGYLVIFDGHGKQYDSVGFSSFLEKGFASSGSHLYFAIGGSLGFGMQVKQRANASVSFGAMTFPHNLARVMALEQIYRAFRIWRHEPYHK